jgi:hypothetical protein
VGGVYTAVLRDGVRTPERFARWLAANDFPTLDEAAVGTSANCLLHKRQGNRAENPQWRRA